MLDKASLFAPFSQFSLGRVRKSHIFFPFYLPYAEINGKKNRK